MRPDQLERQIRERLDALGPALGAEQTDMKDEPELKPTGGAF